MKSFLLLFFSVFLFCMFFFCSSPSPPFFFRIHCFQYHIWDTVNTYLADDEAYSPTVPGKYTWPLPREIGYYSVLYAGPLPPIQCDSSTPAGTTYKGCYKDSKGDRLFDSEAYVLAEMGRDGMTLQVSDFTGMDLLQFSFSCVLSTVHIRFVSMIHISVFCRTIRLPGGGGGVGVNPHLSEVVL